MAAWTFYSVRGTCALATHIALVEAGADFSLVLLDFEQQAQRSAGYLAINFKGRVPALQTPQGVLTENVALLTYIGQMHPEAKLLPSDPFALAKVHEFNTYLAATMHVAHAHRRRAMRWADDLAAQQAMAAKVPHNMRACCADIEANHLQGPWVMGEDYTVADGYLFTLAGWLASDEVDIREFPKIADHFARMQTRPAVQQALAQLAAATAQATV